MTSPKKIDSDVQWPSLSNAKCFVCVSPYEIILNSGCIAVKGYLKSRGENARGSVSLFNTPLPAPLL